MPTKRQASFVREDGLTAVFASGSGAVYREGIEVLAQHIQISPYIYDDDPSDFMAEAMIVGRWCRMPARAEGKGIEDDEYPF